MGSALDRARGLQRSRRPPIAGARGAECGSGPRWGRHVHAATGCSAQGLDAGWRPPWQLVLAVGALSGHYGACLAPAQPAAIKDRRQAGAHAPPRLPRPQVEPSYAPDEQKAWLKDASNAVKRHGFYLRKAIVSGGAGGGGACTAVGSRACGCSTAAWSLEG